MDKKKLLQAIREVGATEWQLAAASILCAVNGLENALEFLYGLQEKGLTGVSLPAVQMSLGLNAAAKEGMNE